MHRLLLLIITAFAMLVATAPASAAMVQDAVVSAEGHCADELTDDGHSAPAESGEDERLPCCKTAKHGCCPLAVPAVDLSALIANRPPALHAAAPTDRLVDGVSAALLEPPAFA